MTPGARVAAAIEILDDIQSGSAAEQALTRWARSSRYAGSKDRAAVRDHVFDVLRCKGSAAAWGGGHSGRALMIGQLRHSDGPLDMLFSGDGHAPAPLTEQEKAIPEPSLAPEEIWNLPAWLCAQFEASLGDAAHDVALALQARAPVTLRVNLARITRDEAAAKLSADGIETAENPLSPSALTVIEGARKIRNCEAYTTGLVELQDASSQAVVDIMPPGGKVLDYCAGGGGKALALAVDDTRQVFAHDAHPARMRDLPVRAERAQRQIEIVDTEALPQLAPFATVLCDAPCSGSGAWRRNPDGKWTLTEDRLTELTRLQDDILSQAAQLTATDGVLVYATCSVLRSENEDRIAAFLDANPGWSCALQRRFDVTESGDGFFTAHLTRV